MLFGGVIASLFGGGGGEPAAEAIITQNFKNLNDTIVNMVNSSDITSKVEMINSQSFTIYVGGTFYQGKNCNINIGQTIKGTQKIEIHLDLEFTVDLAKQIQDTLLTANELAAEAKTEFMSSPSGSKTADQITKELENKLNFKLADQLKIELTQLLEDTQNGLIYAGGDYRCESPITSTQELVVQQFVNAIVRKITGSTLDERYSYLADLKSEGNAKVDAEGLGSGIGDVAKGLGTGVGDAAKGAGEGVGNAGKGLGEGLGNLFKGLGDSFGTIIIVIIVIVCIIAAIFIYIKFFKKKNQADPVSKVATAFGKLLFGKKKIRF